MKFNKNVKPDFGLVYQHVANSSMLMYFTKTAVH